MSMSLVCFTFINVYKQYGKVLLEDTVIELKNGHRYGLIGANGCGMAVIGVILFYFRKIYAINSFSQ